MYRSNLQIELDYFVSIQFNLVDVHSLKNMFKLNKIPDNVPANKIVISKELRNFAILDVYETVRLMNGNIITGTSYHEVIRDTANQKLRFDIDDHDGNMLKLNIDPMEIISWLIKCMENVFNIYYGCTFYPSRDIFLFNSSGYKNDLYIVSYHIVIHRFFVTSTNESKQFFDFCINWLKENCPLYEVIVENRFLDESIYKGDKRQFRIMNSYSGKRRKEIVKNFQYLNEKIEIENSFEQDELSHMDFLIPSLSLITNIHNKCICIKSFQEIQEEVKFVTKKVECSTRILMNLFYRQFGKIGTIYKVDKDKNIIVIKRTRPSYCLLCERRHTSDNMYIVYSEYNSGKVYCYRQKDTDGTKKFIRIKEETDINISTDINTNNSLEKDSNINSNLDSSTFIDSSIFIDSSTNTDASTDINSNIEKDSNTYIDTNIDITSNINTDFNTDLFEEEERLAKFMESSKKQIHDAEEKKAKSRNIKREKVKVRRNYNMVKQLF